jgi:hypothetical protein
MAILVTVMDNGKEILVFGRRPSGGFAVSSVVGPKAVGSTTGNWFVCAAQAMVREIVE